MFFDKLLIFLIFLNSHKNPHFYLVGDIMWNKMKFMQNNYTGGGIKSPSVSILKQKRRTFLITKVKIIVTGISINE